MKISVIMAVYNNDNIKVLKTAIDSILKQTYMDFELIICDDASTDRTYDLLKEIVKTDCRIRLLRNEINLKAGGARNECLKVAKGDFIAIMDSDDISHPQRLEKQLNFLQQHGEYDFAGSRGQFFCTDIRKNDGYYWFCQEPLKRDFLFTLPFVHGSLMFRKEVLLGVKGYSTDKKNVRAEDYELLMRLYSKSYKGFNIDEPLYYIRLDGNTYKRRSYKYRLKECMVKYRGFKSLDLMPLAFPYVVKPLIVGLIPTGLLKGLKRFYYANRI